MARVLNPYVDKDTTPGRSSWELSVTQSVNSLSDSRESIRARAAEIRSSSMTDEQKIESLLQLLEDA